MIRVLILRAPPCCAAYWLTRLRASTDYGESRARWLNDQDVGDVWICNAHCRPSVPCRVSWSQVRCWGLSQAVLSGSLSVYSRFKMYESLNKCTSKVMSYCHNLNTTLPHYVLTLRYFIVFWLNATQDHWNAWIRLLSVCQFDPSGKLTET